MANYAVRLTGFGNAMLKHCSIDSEFDGVYIDANESVVDGCRIEADEVGLVVDGVSRCLIQNNRFDDVGSGTNNTYDAVELTGTGSENVVQNNRVWGTKANKHRYSVNIGASHTDTYVLGNTLTNAATSEINDAGTTSHFDVETNGSDTIADTNSSVTVSHGLPFAPTSVVVTPDKDEHTWVTGVTATQFVINRAGTSGALVCRWVAALPK